MFGGGYGNVSSFWGVLALVFNLLSLCIFIRALLSWVQPDPRNPIVQALNAITEPILQPLRQVVPRFGGLDITPLVAIILLSAIAQLVAGI